MIRVPVNKYLNTYSDPRTNWGRFPYKQDVYTMFVNSLNAKLPVTSDVVPFGGHYDVLEFRKYRLDRFQLHRFMALHMANTDAQWQLRCFFTVIKIPRGPVFALPTREQWEEAERLANEENDQRRQVGEMQFISGRLTEMTHDDYDGQTFGFINTFYQFDHRFSDREETAEAIGIPFFRPFAEKLAYHLNELIQINNLIRSGYTDIQDPQSPAFAMYKHVSDRVTYIVRTTGIGLPGNETLVDVFDILLRGLRSPNVRI